MREKADILCLQEIIDYPADGLLFAPFHQLAEHVKLKESFHSPVMSFPFMNNKAHFGNGIISRFPFKKKETIFTNLRYVENFSFEEHDYNIRNLQHVIVDVDGKDLHVLNHHGHHVREHKNGNEDTMRQCKQIADYIATLEGPVILAGDFNLSPESESIEQIARHMRNLPLEYGLKTTHNMLTTKTEVCDYIFVNEDVQVQKFHMLDDIISDHAALVLEFDI